MKKIDLNLDFDAIRERIDNQKKTCKPGVWAKMVGVSVNVVSNVHGKTRQKPSLEYIIAVAKATGKPVDYYLWGDKEGEVTDDAFDGITQKIIEEHVELIKRFRNPEVGKNANQWLIDTQELNKELFDQAIDSIKKIRDAAVALGNIPGGNCSASNSTYTGPERRSKPRPARAKKGARIKKSGTDD